ncbi:MAG: hypothetical protein ACXVJD_13480 [Mucilaginibacter sp.]
MKKAAKEQKINEGPVKNTASKTAENAQASQLRTDYPLSEKDEVKQAETNMQRRRRDIF